jgi:hypothetical protein
MPTIIRFVTTLIVLAVLFGAAVFALGNFVEPRIREMTIRIPPSRLEPRPVARPAPAPSPPATAAGTDPKRNGGAMKRAGAAPRAPTTSKPSSR